MGSCDTLQPELIASSRSLQLGRVRMRTTAYFRDSVMKRRPYLKREWIEFVIANPENSEVQENGRIRLWAYIESLGGYLRVILEPDGKTVHNAFPDRGFEE